MHQGPALGIARRCQASFVRALYAYAQIMGAVGLAIQTEIAPIGTSCFEDRTTIPCIVGAYP